MNIHMKAIIYSKYGSRDLLRCEEIDKPTPGDDEVLIKVRAASVNPLDAGSMRHPFIRRLLFALSKSKVNRPGRDVAGQVEAVGRNVTQFKPGDAVFGWCGGRRGHLRCADRQIVRRGSYGRVQCQERRNGPIHRR